MIPKFIHYIWIGGNPLPELATKCIASWEKKCPDYEVVLWNEENLNIEECLFTKQAYEMKKYGFVTDYFRLKVIFEQGGIYLDTDVEVLKSFDELLNFEAFFGFENVENVNTGGGFGAEKGCKVLKALMTAYENIPFVKEDGTFDMTPCPQRDAATFKKFGMKSGGGQTLDKVMYFPAEYFSPINAKTGKLLITDKTFSIHHYMGSWQDENQKKNKKNRYLLIKIFGEKIGIKINNFFLALKEKSVSEFFSYIFTKVSK
jgi:hypothetical protein